MEHEYILDGIQRTVSLEKKEGRYILREGAVEFEAEIRRISGNEIEVRAGGRSCTVSLAGDGPRRFLNALGRSFVLSEPSRDSNRFAGSEDKEAGQAAAVKAPMPGRVIKLCVSEGQAVRKHQSLLIVEAMKMENDIRSPLNGVVRKIHVSAGEIVDSEKILVELEPKAQEAAAG